MSADLAWLAGLWDGEGSVGATISRAGGRRTHVPSIQISMTHRPTIERASKIYADTFGCVIKIHDIRPSDSVRHKPAYYFAIRRTIWLSRISEALIPYSTTKFNHWRLLHELCEERAARCGRTISGGLFRGGIASKRAPYTEREHALVLALREANAYANNRSRTRMEASAA